MTKIKQVYSEEYLETLNKALKNHSDYRADMEFNQIDRYGNVVFKTKEKILSHEDKKILNEVIDTIRATHKIIMP